MVIRSGPVVLGTILLLGCSGPVYFYPVRGPISDAGRARVIEGRFIGVGSGRIEVILPGGEPCSGPWATVRPAAEAGASGPGAGREPMGPAWDAVYGPGFYVAKVLGSHSRARAVLRGPAGTVLDVELYRELKGDTTPRGVARDQHGNVFKVVL